MGPNLVVNGRQTGVLISIRNVFQQEEPVGLVSTAQEVQKVCLEGPVEFKEVPKSVTGTL